MYSVVLCGHRHSYCLSLIEGRIYTLITSGILHTAQVTSHTSDSDLLYWCESSDPFADLIEFHKNIRALGCIFEGLIVRCLSYVCVEYGVYQIKYIYNHHQVRDTDVYRLYE